MLSKSLLTELHQSWLPNQHSWKPDLYPSWGPTGSEALPFPPRQGHPHSVHGKQITKIDSRFDQRNRNFSEPREQPEQTRVNRLLRIPQSTRFRTALTPYSSTVEKEKMGKPVRSKHVAISSSVTAGVAGTLAADRVMWLKACRICNELSGQEGEL